MHLKTFENSIFIRKQTLVKLLGRVFVRGSRILTVDKLTSTKLYSYLTSAIKVKPSSNRHFEILFKDNDIDWKAINMLPPKTAYITSLQSFQYKILTFFFCIEKCLFLNLKRPSSVRFGIGMMKHLFTCFSIAIL